MENDEKSLEMFVSSYVDSTSDISECQVEVVDQRLSDVKKERTFYSIVAHLELSLNDTDVLAGKCLSISKAIRVLPALVHSTF